ncbi:MAG TPA: hypothetical protein DCW83_08690 [Saprospirales bacterium]|jgi:hypothetical protein|nr:hypothetical protein [Saprospirales bacterium]
MFVVKTQILENYGSHAEDGKFSSGNAYWKMKGGNDYIVHDLDRAQDALAFVAAKYTSNDLDWKEFPTEVITWDAWQEELTELSEDYRTFLIEQSIACSPEGML